MRTWHCFWHPLPAFRADIGISVLLLKVPTSTMSNFNAWRDDNWSQHASSNMSPETSLTPTQSSPSPVDFDMGPISHTADDFTQMYQNWYMQSLHDPNSAGPPPMLFIIRQPPSSPHQTPITIWTPAFLRSPLPWAGYMSRTPRVNLPQLVYNLQGSSPPTLQTQHLNWKVYCLQTRPIWWRQGQIHPVVVNGWALPHRLWRRALWPTKGVDCIVLVYERTECCRTMGRPIHYSRA